MMSTSDPRPTAGTSTRLLEALAAVPLFSRLELDQLQAIAGEARTIRVAPGTHLLEVGTVPEHLSIMISGAGVMTVDGEPIASIGPGEVIAEFALIDDTPSTVGITATEPTTLWRVDRKAIAWACERYPDLASVMLAGVVSRLRASNISLANLGPAARTTPSGR
ncbi:MAG: Crp/Fnr family transcriptional regulator [Actinomycetota bacterium]